MSKHDTVTYADLAIHLCKMGPDFLANYLRNQAEVTSVVYIQLGEIKKVVDRLSYYRENNSQNFQLERLDDYIQELKALVNDAEVTV